jgi:hypothetical protein
MTNVVVPDGELIQVGPAAAGVDPLTTNRETRYRFDLLDVAGLKFGDLDGVSSGTIEWNANSQVKGGGKVVVSKANAVHDQEIRVSRNAPVVTGVDFETDDGGFAGDTEGGEYAIPAAVVRTTDEFYEGGAALDIEWAAPGSPVEQNATGEFTGLVPGEVYTFVARVLNVDASNAHYKVADFDLQPLAQDADWQTVAISFSPDDTTARFGVENHAPEAATHTYVDTVVLYEGIAEGFNGETFEYAPFSWLHARVRPVLIIEGVGEEPLGVFVPTAPVEQYDEGGGRQEIELLDRTSVLKEDYVPATYTVKAGTNVIAAVKQVIASTGEPVGALTPSDDTLPSDLMWGAGSNKLTIINELLSAAGYFALWADGNGQFRADKYDPPKERPVTYELLDDENSIYIPTLSIDRDIYEIPNRVIMTAQGSGESEPWTSVATNENPKSAFSFQNRGRWVTDVQLGIEATSQEALDSKANARLSALTSTQATVEIQHAPVPGLKVNDVVRLRRDPADVDTLFTVTKTSANFDPTSLAKTTLTEVVDL